MVYYCPPDLLFFENAVPFIMFCTEKVKIKKGVKAYEALGRTFFKGNR